MNAFSLAAGSELRAATQDCKYIDCLGHKFDWGPRRKGGGDRVGGHSKQTYVLHLGCPIGGRSVLPNCAAELAAEVSAE